MDSLLRRAPLVSEWQWMSNYTVAELTSDGLPGVWNHNFYTGWYPGYLLWVTNTRNAVGQQSTDTGDGDFDLLWNALLNRNDLGMGLDDEEPTP